MARSRSSLLLIVLLMLSGCIQDSTTDPVTPTPFASEADLFRAPAGEPIAISLDHLAANPEFFEGTTLQLTGQYQRLPQLVCGRDPHPSPATWGIVGDGLMINATGHEPQLRTLLAEGQQITAEGHWLRYTGPVGCGKSAPVQEILFLSVSRIVEPHPLARATAVAEVLFTPTLVATDENADQVATDPVEITGTTVATPTAVFVPTQEIATHETQTVISPSPFPSTATALPSVTVSPNATGTLTVTATVTGTPTDGTATPVNGSATPSASATPSDQNINDKGQIDFEELIVATLDSGEIDNWTIGVDSSDSITITVAPAISSNIILSILDENGETEIHRQDQAPAGAVETITNLSLTEPGLYQVHVSSEATDQTNYALMVLNSESYNLIFRGVLVPDFPRTDNLAPDNDHFWFFSASDGENIDMSVSTSGQADPYVELFGPDGSRLLTIDDEGEGQTEVLEDYSMLSTGLYAIRVGEFDFAAMSYQIILSKS